VTAVARGATFNDIGGVIGFTDYQWERGEDTALTDQRGGNPSSIGPGEEDVGERSYVELGPVESGRESDDEYETPMAGVVDPMLRDKEPPAVGIAMNSINWLFNVSASCCPVMRRRESSIRTSER
jgi:hypothetical protein